MPSNALKQIENIRIDVSPKAPLPASANRATKIECELKAVGNATHGGLKPDGEIKLDPGRGPFCIQFTLKGGLQWEDQDPLWIKEGDCPQSAQVASQVWLDRKPNGKTLTLLNMNVGDACELHYRMNFKGDYYCDPVIRNGGGNIFSISP